MTMQEALNLLDQFIDPSDPDVDLPNSVHVYQTAERIRKDYPNDKQLQICGLIHDLGKILFKFGEPNWSVVGDTFPVGCKYQKSIIYYNSLKKNPDYHNSKYNSKYGIYSKNCGIQNIKLSFGHDEYLYLILKNNTNHNLSEKYINIIRFHSFYPWHTGKDYHYFMNDKDNQILKDVLNFNKYDLYSKNDDTYISPDVKKYYTDLLKTFFPEPLQW
jgi:inositol oxygenase